MTCRLASTGRPARGAVFSSGTGVLPSTRRLPSFSNVIRSVFHKGELVGGKVVSTRTLSTGLERATVEALDRAGNVHQFDIPADILRKWEFDGLVQRFRDLDEATGAINEELRFAGSLAEELNKYLVK